MAVTTVAPDQARVTELDLGDRQFVLRDYYGSLGLSGSCSRGPRASRST